MVIFRSSASLLLLVLLAKTSAQGDESMSGFSELADDDIPDDIPGAIDPDDLPIVGDKTVDVPVTGGWMQIDVTAAEVALLDQASRTANWDVEDVLTPGVCVLELLLLEMQVVDGFQYRFGVRGCPVTSKDELGSCQDAECAAASYEMEVYAPFWQKEMQVTNVTLLA